METKTAVMVVMLCVGAAGAVVGLLSVFKPQSAREAEAVTASATTGFPARKAGGADMSAEKMSAPEEWGGNGARPKSGTQPNGSLNFIRNAEGMSSGEEAGSAASAEAAAAAARGDAKGLMAGLQKDDEGKGMGKKATRALMQKVVDLVHQSQPRWYNEFLQNKELKGIAEAYDKGQDFGSFLSQLAKSTPFRSMLKKRSNTSQLRGLTKRLMTDGEIGPKMEELFFAHAKDPDVLNSIREFGPGAGLPSELLSFAGAGSKKTAAAKPKLGGKMKLQPRAFGSKGGFSSSKGGDSGGGGGEGEAPADVDPAMLQQYQKYMKK